MFCTFCKTQCCSLSFCSFWFHIRSSAFLVMFYITKSNQVYIWCYSTIDVMWYLYKELFYSNFFFDKDHRFFLYYFYLYKAFIQHCLLFLQECFLVFFFFFFFWCNIKIVWKSFSLKKNKRHDHCMKLHRHLATCFIFVCCFPFKVSLEMPNIFFWFVCQINSL